MKQKTDFWKIGLCTIKIHFIWKIPDKIDIKRIDHTEVSR